MAEFREQLEKTLNELSISTVSVDHPEVFTVDAMLPHLDQCKGLITKNLFLKGKKKKDLWLISVGHNKQVSLNELSKKLSVSGGFRFADETLLEEKLCVKQGCVNPLSVLFDTKNLVTLVLDNDVKNLTDDERVYCHPMVNTCTIGLTSQDFLKFVEHTGHSPRFVEVETNDKADS